MDDYIQPKYTKSERREKIRKNRGKMIVQGRGVFNLLRLIRSRKHETR